MSRKEKSRAAGQGPKDGALGELDTLLRQAITQRRLIRFSLDDHVRIAEPHDYGIKGGVPQLLVYQVGGTSGSGGLPNWRWVRLSRATDVELLEQAFPGGRSVPSGKHSAWDRLVVRVRPAR